MAAPAAATKISRKKAMWGPVEVDGVSQFPTYADLGVGIYQYTLNWADVAPTRPADTSNPSDPAYRWPEAVDEAISEGDKHGIKVSLMLIGAPEWANGGKPWRFAPDDPQDFATFAAAASRRYPRVRHWMIWSEPTKASNFQPLEPARGKRLRGRKELAGPHRYAEILDDSYVALNRVTKANKIIGGNTFTVGTVAPLQWVKALKLPGGRRPRMDLWGHNPFSSRQPRLKGGGHLTSGYADFNDLDRLAGKLDKAFRRAPLKRERHLKLFLSEFSLPTDHANFEFNFFMDRATQAKYLTRALRISRRYRRIYTFGYLSLYDDPLRPEGDQVERGLITREGEHKPGYAAFKNG